MNKIVALKSQQYCHYLIKLGKSRTRHITTTTAKATRTSKRTPRKRTITFRYNSSSNDNQIRHRRQRYNPTTTTTKQQRYQYQQPIPNPTRPLDVARFGLLSIATLPFSLWIALYSYNYYNRVDHCRVSLGEGDADWEISNKFSNKYQNDNSNNNNNSKNQQKYSLVGRKAQLDEIHALLENSPHQIIVVAGANESGKSRFISELIRTIHGRQGVTYIQLAQIVDSLSTLTYAFVRSFNLKWLHMRYALVDILPFAGSEILVMKERFSSRDFVQALLVITEALKEHAQQLQNQKRLPVIIVDGLGEGSGWIRTSSDGRQCFQRLLKWCVYVTKEIGLCHIILTGNEELVISLTDSNRVTRGHVKVIGLGDLDVPSTSDSSDQSSSSPSKSQNLNLKDYPPGQIILQEFPDATNEEIRKITDTFGGFIHDLSSTSRQIRYELSQLSGGSGSGSGSGSSSNAKTKKMKPTKKERAKIIDRVLSERFRMQVERVTAAFARGKDDSAAERAVGNKVENDDDDSNDLDPYLDPLKEVYSEAQASQKDNVDDNEPESLGSYSSASWTQLQLWKTLQMLVNSKDMTVPFADLRDDVFGGDMTPLLDLMHEDVLGFEVVDAIGSDSRNIDVGSLTGFSWQVKPATPALRRVFQYLVNDSSLRERFLAIQTETDRKEKLEENEQERLSLFRERRRLDMRKDSILKTVELGKVLNMEDILVRENIEDVYKGIVSEDIEIEERGLELRNIRESLLHRALSSSSTSSDHNVCDDQTTDNNPPKVEERMSPSKSSSSRYSEEYASIQRQVLAAIQNSHFAEEEKKKFRHLRDKFENLAKSNAGFTASDLVRLLKKSSGVDLDLESAVNFIRVWDENKDDHLDYDEFVEMLLTDRKPSSRGKPAGDSIKKSQ